MSQILGIPETLAAFARLQVEAEAGEEIAATAGAQVVAADARKRAPVSTGALAASIRVENAEEGAQVVATVPYARFVEYGTRFMPAQSFMRESAEAVGDQVGTAMTTVFKRILR